MQQTLQTLGHYDVVEPIGCGGTSIVYRAIDRRSQQEVAIKVLHPYLAGKEDSRRRIEREAQTISKLHHENILRVYDFSASSDLYIVTELVHGLTLKEFGQKFQLWNVPEIGALIVRELALALQYAHQHHVVHRDIKAENIMVRDDGVLKIMDFGIAWVHDQESLTVTGALIGSPAHMAPEIIQSKESDQRADIFSLSTVFYCLVTGRLPFEGSNAHALLKSVVEGRSKPIDELSTKVTAQLQRIIEKGMATLPEDRYQSAGEFAAAIDEALATFSIRTEQHELARILANPTLELSELSTKVKGAALREARSALKAGRLADSRLCLNRVLADDPQNAEATELVEKFPVVQVRGGRIRFVLIAGVLSSAVALGALFIWMSSEISPLPLDRVISPPLEKGVGGFIEEQSRKNPPTPFSKGGEITLATASPKGEKKHTVIITVTPFADIFIDGKLSAQNSSRLEVALGAGKHKVLFKHAFAATEQRELRIGNDNTPKRLHIDLDRVKSSTLVIRSDVNADVAVDGIYKGTTHQSAERPILITFPEKSYRRKVELVVSQKGFFPYIATHTLIPGKKEVINVKLDPEPS